MANLNVCACDLGASNGRTIISEFDGKTITLNTSHRFPNNYVFIKDYMYWDTLSLFHNLKVGLNEFAKHSHGTKKLASVGIDSWGVDFGLLNRHGQLLSTPRCYRDEAFNALNMEACQERLGGKRKLFEQTGIASLVFNTIYQLYSMIERGEECVQNAKTLLFTPDLLNYFLCGEKHTEFTMATTSQLFDVNANQWSYTIMDKLNINKEIFTEVSLPGKVVGKLLPIIEQEVGLKDVSVISVASHDTASAVAAVPAKSKNFAFISSGTWSLIGMISDKPLMSDHIFDHNISNEGTADGRFRPLINIVGLWITQELKRHWDREGQELSFDELESAAMNAKPFQCFIRPDDFNSAMNMPGRIQEFCAKTNQYVPQTKGEIMRCAFESIALRYRWALEGFAQAVGKKADVLHIVGGGIKNKILNQFAANATGLHTVCGPVEATAIGNIMTQLKALGEITDSQVNDCLRASFEQTEYEPQETAMWDDAYGRFLKLYE